MSRPYSTASIRITYPVGGICYRTAYRRARGGIVASRAAVSAGLALLGINDFSGMPVKPRAFQHAGITTIPVSNKQNGTNNNINAAVEVVDMQQFLTQAGPPGPVVSNPFAPLSSQAAGLLVQKLDPAQVSVTIKREANNNAENKTPGEEEKETDSVKPGT